VSADVPASLVSGVDPGEFASAAFSAVARSAFLGLEHAVASFADLKAANICLSVRDRETSGELKKHSQLARLEPLTGVTRKAGGKHRLKLGASRTPKPLGLLLLLLGPVEGGLCAGCSDSRVTGALTLEAVRGTLEVVHISPRPIQLG
jgi:hypothetical protein